MAARDREGFEASDDTVIWRYMPKRRLAGLLSDGLHFSAAGQFDDQFEGAIGAERAAWQRQVLGSNVDDGPFKQLRTMTMVSCWHGAALENVAMWERYRRVPTESLIAVRSTVGALKSSLRPFRLRPTYGEEDIFVGAVRYVSYSDGPGPSHDWLNRSSSSEASTPTSGRSAQSCR